MNEKFINRVEEIIISNIDNEQFGVQELAVEIGLSRSQLLRKIKSLTGKSVNQIIREIRLIESLKLLKEGNYTSSEISYKVGFNSPSYFTKCFHDFYGCPPGEFNFSNRNEIHSIKNLWQKNKIRSLFKKITFVLILSAICIAGYSIFYKQTKETFSIAVLPFKDLSENRDKEYLSDGFTEALILELAGIDNLRVPSRTTLMQYKDSDKNCKKIARELKVDLILEGSCQVVSGNLSVVAKLIKPIPKEDHLWESRYNSKYENILQLVEQISAEIASEISLKVENKEKEVNSEAFINYLKGRYLYNQQNSKSVIKSIDYLNNSVELDSSFALSFATLAEAYISLNELSIDSKSKPLNRIKAKNAIEKAMALNSTSAEILITKGNILGKFDWDWRGMKTMLDEGMKLDPLNAKGHMLLAEYYLIKGDKKRSIKEASLAQELDPLNLMLGCFLGEILYISKEYEKAINQYEKVIELNPNYGFARDGIGYVYLMTGQKEKALASWQKLMLIMNNEKMSQVYLNEPFEIAILNWIKGAVSYSPQYCSNPTIIAQAYIFIDKKEEALRYLEIAFENHDEELPFKLLQPHFSSLQSDPRFQKLADNIGVVLNK